MRNPGFLFSAALIVASIACSSVAERHDRFVESGEEAMAAGRTSEAIIAYRNAAQLDPLSVKARLGLAETLTKSGDARGALEEYVRAADLKPDDLILQVNTGNLLLAVGKLDDARTRAESVLQKDPTHVEAHIHLGQRLVEILISA